MAVTGSRVVLRDRVVREALTALQVDNRMTNSMIQQARSIEERAAAELRERWRVLKHVSRNPSRIGDIARTDLVLNQRWK